MRGPLSLEHRAWDLALIRKEKEQMCFILFIFCISRQGLRILRCQGSAHH